MTQSDIVDMVAFKEATLESSNILADGLRGYKATRNRRNKAYAFNGGLCTLVKMEADGKPSKCIRCWYKRPDDPDTLQRLKLIADGLKKHKLKIGQYFIGYDIYEKAIHIEGATYPGLVMDWVEGKTLGAYVDEGKEHNSQEITRVAGKFAEMCEALNNAGMSHGDLSAGNVMIMKDGAIKLIDYDSLYFPEMGRRRQSVAGDEAYQHPGRKFHQWSELYTDYFSQHLIYASLLLISHDDSLRPETGDKNLVFNQLDLANRSAFEKSKGYKSGIGKKDEVLTAELKLIAKALDGKFADVPPFRKPRPVEQPKPTVKLAAYCAYCSHHFIDGNDLTADSHKFCPMCGNKRKQLTA